MRLFFRCLLEEVIEKGVQGLLELIPGGKYGYEIASGSIQRYREKKTKQKIEDDLKEMIAASKEEVIEAVDQVVKQVGNQLPEREKKLVSSYLTSIPEFVRQSMVRKEDPTGRTLPNGYAIRTTEDLANLLQQHPPRFVAGDPIIGLPGWELVERLGGGGCGEVWLARNKGKNSERGAIKFAYAERAAMLRHEARVISRLMREGAHPGIVRLLQANLEQQIPWILYEYVPGNIDLSVWINALKQKPIKTRVGQAMIALRQLSTVIAHFHKAKPPIVHRDLKPTNILVDPVTRRLKITDFGIGLVAAKATLNDEAMGSTVGAIGQLSILRGAHTPIYTSPQQRNGNDPDPRDDVHALGVIGFQLLTGDMTRAPATDYKHELSFLGVDADLVELIGECVSHSPSLRPADGQALVQRVQKITGSKIEPEIIPLEKSFEPLSSSNNKSKKLRYLEQKGSNSDHLDPPVSGKKRLKSRRSHSREQNWLLIGGTIAGVILVGTLLAFLIRGGISQSGYKSEHEKSKAGSAPSDPPTKSRTATANAIPTSMVEHHLNPSVSMVFCTIPSGTSKLGSPKGEPSRNPKLEDERDFSTNGFWLGKYEVTQLQWTAVMGNNPSGIRGYTVQKLYGVDTSNFPVESVTWTDIQLFLQKLNAPGDAQNSFGVAGVFTLPSEDEWEYASRGGKGNSQPFYFGKVLDGHQANTKGTEPYGTRIAGPFLDRTTPVGSYSKAFPHPWGLCDMHGNVWEFCESVGPSPVNMRAIRGGSFGDSDRCRAANREFTPNTTRYHNLGFRVCFRPK